MRLHFAKTGTQVTADRDATVDTWIAGGLQFANGAAYSYVVLVGTGIGAASRGRAACTPRRSRVPLLDAC